MAEQKSSSALTAPLRGAASVLRRVPGAGMVGRAAGETLDKIGAVSPRGRRIAVYTGAGVLGAAGVVEWPVAVTGAAVAWLTQPRPARPAQAQAGDAAGPGPEPVHDLGAAALRSGAGGGGSGSGRATAGDASAGAGTPGTTGTSDGTGASGGTGMTAGMGMPVAAEQAPGPVRATDRGHHKKGSGHRKKGSAHHAEDCAQHAEASGTDDAATGVRTSSSPLGPTARPDRTTL